MLGLMLVKKPALFSDPTPLSATVDCRGHGRSLVVSDVNEAVVALRLVLQLERVPCLPQ